jgi:hypothetical protein
VTAKASSWWRATQRFEHVVDALSAEAQTLKKVMDLAQFVGCNRLVIMSGYLVAVEMMKKLAIAWQLRS